MFKRFFSVFGDAKPDRSKSIPTGKELIDAMTPTMVSLMRKFAYQEAHLKFPEKLFANPSEVIAAISNGSTSEYGNWTKRTLKTGKIAYLTKYPDYPIQPGEGHPGVGAVIVNPSDPSNPEYFVMNILSQGPRVRKVYLNEEGNVVSVRDGPGCENNIEAFFQLLDSGKSGMEREREQVRNRLEAQGVKFYDAE